MGDNNAPRNSCENLLNDAFEHLGVDPEMQEQRLNRPWEQVKSRPRRDDVNYRKAAYVIALERIINAINIRGF